MDAFSGYDNSLGFYVGNEIIDQADQSMAAPYIKAAARDMKAYRNSKGYRAFPIGYSAADIAQLRPMLQNYLTCGGNSSDNVDFFSLNSYEWCGDATYESSGYANLESEAVNFPVPIFFSETGCNVPEPRTFADQSAIFGPNMVDNWSGAIIYEWIQEQNNYGLISYGPPAAATATGSNIVDGFTRKGTPTPISPDFTNLQNVWATLSPTGVASSNYNPSSVSTRACPTSGDGGWLVDGNVKLPTLGQTYSGGSYTPAPTATGPIAPATNPPATPSDPPATGSDDPPATGSGTSATGSGTRGSEAGSASPSSASNPASNPASVNKELAGMSAGLFAVLLLFTVWL